MSKAKKITEWILIGLFLALVVLFGTIFIYHSVINSDWYHKKQTLKGFEATVEKLNASDNIKNIKLDDNRTVRFIEEFPSDLFDDLSIAEYRRVEDLNILHDLWTQKCVTVFFKDGTTASFYITKEKELYWSESLKVACPSLVSWFYETLYPTI